MLGLFGLKAGFNEVDQDAAGAGVTGCGQSEDALRNARGERDALTDRGVEGSHGIIVTQMDGAWDSRWPKSNQVKARGHDEEQVMDRGSNP